ncbi:helix-turn-helix domain-containing protein [Paenibacillus frigoriresistens]|uniref:response regulator transcription factor n=1 Tax=Paenibacillus alginolyticus TaxID=59839 RepID=UPI001566F21E|nr:helix-turn-helix domain-containing protein [Paenibacillus frigoriresistens]NRF95125.1 helix-turn-helix domain-containing protein [Paenibacillus frigoriresistens]
MKLLITDDQLSIHKFLDKMIEWEKHGITEVLHAFNGKEALEIIESRCPDILILDIKMPFFDGIEVLQKSNNWQRRPRTLILSAYDEFEYAREAMLYGIKHYLLKPIDTGLFNQFLREVVLEVRRDLHSQLEASLMRILQTSEGYQVQWETIIHGAHSLGIDLYCTVLIRLPIGYMNDFLRWILPDHEKNVFLQTSATELYILHSLSEEETAEQAALYYRERLEEFHQNYGIEMISAGVSSIQHELRAFPESVLQCQYADSFGFYLPNAVHMFNRSQFSTQMDSVFVTDWADKIVEKFKTGYTHSSLEEFLKQLFGKLERMRMHPDKVRQSCGSILLLIHQKLPLNRKDPLPQFDLFENAATFSQVQRILSTSLMELFYQQEYTEKSTSIVEVMNKIKNLVDTKYNEDLSLQRVAAQFYMNRYQLSRQFKNVIGINYWLYVTQVRMNKAAELLQFTNHKISTIAGMVGFEDESNFSHAFRKHFGTGPKDYRSTNKTQVLSNNSNVRT